MRSIENFFFLLDREKFTNHFVSGKGHQLEIKVPRLKYHNNYELRFHDFLCYRYVY